jgi:hypothetical protein
MRVGGWAGQSTGRIALREKRSEKNAQNYTNARDAR